MTIKTLGLMALLGFLALGFAHYAAPRVLGRELRRLEAYVAGVLVGIWFPVAAATWWFGLGWDAFAAVTVASVGAGAGTALAWWLDKHGGLGWVRGLLDALLGGLEDGAHDDEQDRLAD